jgi:hypothetical protein
MKCSLLGRASILSSALLFLIMTSILRMILDNRQMKCSSFKVNLPFDYFMVSISSICYFLFSIFSLASFYINVTEVLTYRYCLLFHHHPANFILYTEEEC